MGKLSFLLLRTPKSHFQADWCTGLKGANSDPHRGHLAAIGLAEMLRRLITQGAADQQNTWNVLVRMNNHFSKWWIRVSVLIYNWTPLTSWLVNNKPISHIARACGQGTCHAAEGHLLVITSWRIGKALFTSIPPGTGILLRRAPLYWPNRLSEDPPPSAVALEI